MNQAYIVFSIICDLDSAYERSSSDVIEVRIKYFVPTHPKVDMKCKAVGASHTFTHKFLKSFGRITTDAGHLCTGHQTILQVGLHIANVFSSYGDNMSTAKKLTIYIRVYEWTTNDECRRPEEYG